MSSIAENLNAIGSTLPREGVELVAVSKFHPVNALVEAYAAGQRSFGESRAFEMRDKAAALPHDISWHFIGHLQTNKVKTVVPVASLIHSIDSERLLLAVNAEAERIGKNVDVLLQVHVAQEDTKFGFSPDELIRLVTPDLISSLHRTHITGIMGMASNTEDTDRIRADFRAIRSCFDTLSAGAFNGDPAFRTVSMGMSHDYLIAIEEGSTMVRVGSAIFGDRI